MEHAGLFATFLGPFVTCLVLLVHYWSFWYILVLMMQKTLTFSEWSIMVHNLLFSPSTGPFITIIKMRQGPKCTLIFLINMDR